MASDAVLTECYYVCWSTDALSLCVLYSAGICTSHTYSLSVANSSCKPVYIVTCWPHTMAIDIMHRVADDAVAMTTTVMMMMMMMCVCVCVFSCSFCLSCQFDYRNVSMQKRTVRRSGMMALCCGVQQCGTFTVYVYPRAFSADCDY